MSDSNKEVLANLGNPTAAELKSQLKINVPDSYFGYLVCVVNQTIGMCRNWRSKPHSALFDDLIQRDLAARCIRSMPLA